MLFWGVIVVYLAFFPLSQGSGSRIPRLVHNFISHTMNWSTSYDGTTYSHYKGTYNHCHIRDVDLYHSHSGRIVRDTAIDGVTITTVMRGQVINFDNSNCLAVVLFLLWLQLCGWVAGL